MNVLQGIHEQTFLFCLFVALCECILFLMRESIAFLEFQKGLKVKMLVTQLCPTHCDPMDCSPPGSSVHGILQATILEWVLPFPSPRDLPNPGIEPRSPALQEILYHLSHQEGCITSINRNNYCLIQNVLKYFL